MLLDHPLTALIGRPFFVLNMLLLSVFGPVLLVALWQQWRHARWSKQARYEATLNRKALLWLHKHDDWDKVCLPDESPRETMYLPGWKPRWLLVTNRRVLLFAASARERRLQQEWTRRDVVFAGHPDQEPLARPARLWRRLLLARTNLTLRFHNGDRLTLRCASAFAAARVAKLLMQARPMVAPAVLAAPSDLRRPKAHRRWHEVAASFVIPGCGQWLQDRFVSGTVLFTAAVLLSLLDWGSIVWAAYEPKMHVSLLSKTLPLFTWLALALAAADAFHFSSTRKRVS